MKLLTPESVRTPARKRRGWLLRLALLMIPVAMIPVAAIAAGEPPSRIVLRVPQAALHAGQPAILAVELTGENGKPAVATVDVKIELQGLGGLSQTASLTIPAGSSRAELPIQAPKPGLWQIEARSYGLVPGSGVVACVGERAAMKSTQVILKKTQEIPGAQVIPRKTQEIPGARVLPQERVLTPRDRVLTQVIRPELRHTLPPPPPPTAKPEPAATPAPSATAESVDTAPAPSSGRVELIAQPAKLRRVPGGRWESSRIEAFWFEGDAPGLSPRDLSLNLIIDGSGSTTADPSLLSIPSGGIRSQAPALISAREVGTATVRALYPGGQSKSVQLEFLKASPTRLRFKEEQESFRGLAWGGTELHVRLLDDDGLPAVTEKPVDVDVTVAGPTGTQSYSATIKPDSTQAPVALKLNRPGSYTIQASAPGLQDSNTVTVRFAVDWQLLSMALLGGVLGSLTRVLYRRDRRERVWPKGVLRVLVLGVMAALLVLLLSLFGLLSLLSSRLPEGVSAELQKVSATSLFGVLLLGYLGGLLFDKVLGRFLDSGGRGKPSPKARAATA